MANTNLDSVTFFKKHIKDIFVVEQNTNCKVLTKWVEEKKRSDELFYLSRSKFFAALDVLELE